MAGHSKWANIRFRKGAQDKKRGKIFTVIIREITVAARMGGGDPSANPRLRAAIDKGLSNNMPKDNIERAVKRGTGELEGGVIEEITYEGYGPSGVAVMVNCMTDNRNRTVAEVRHAFSKAGGNLGTDGSVAYMFTKQGVISFDDSVDEDKVMELALEADADDVVTNDDGSVDVITSPENFIKVKESLTGAGLESVHADIIMEPNDRTELDVDTAEKVLRLIDKLEDLDDVQEVYSNAAFPEEVME